MGPVLAKSEQETSTPLRPGERSRWPQWQPLKSPGGSPNIDLRRVTLGLIKRFRRRQMTDAQGASRTRVARVSVRRRRGRSPPVLKERGDACEDLILDPTPPLHLNLGMHLCPGLCRPADPIMCRTSVPVQHTRQANRPPCEAVTGGTNQRPAPAI